MNEAVKKKRIFALKKKNKILAVVSKAPTTSKRQKTDPTINLVTAAKLSTKKAHIFCKTLAKSGICLQTPTQSGVYKAVTKAEKLKNHCMETFKNEKWTLHFDRKEA